VTDELAPRSNPFVTWLGLDRERRAMSIEALIALVGASLAIRVLPFVRVGDMASRPLGTRAAEQDFLPKVVWAVTAWAERVPWRAVCFQKGLAAQMMLRRRGVDSTLYFGAARRPETGLEAHVWVKVGEIDVIGGEEAPDFAVLASFPRRGRRRGQEPRKFDGQQPISAT
jgi:hypothetical protein